MVLDADVVAASPSSVYRVLKEAGRIGCFNGRTNRKGTGFQQPLRAHEHWHADVSDRREMIRYPEFIAKGWQIDSGPMESQCRVLSDRVRRSGMRWDADNAEAVMALEAMEQSHQWSQYWKLAMLHTH